MAIAAPAKSAKRFRPKFHIRVLGSAAPVFPGFEVDILDRVPDDEKPEAVWHRDRARAILRAHPEVRELFGHSPQHGIVLRVCAGSQVALAAVSAHLPIWAVIALAWVFGSMLNVCLFQLAHECNHNLIFKKTFWNRVMLHLHLAADVFVGASHLVGRASDAPQRHGGEKRFHHPAADVFSNIANSLADVFPVFAA